MSRRNFNWPMSLCPDNPCWPFKNQLIQKNIQWKVKAPHISIPCTPQSSQKVSINKSFFVSACLCPLGKLGNSHTHLQREPFKLYTKGIMMYSLLFLEFFTRNMTWRSVHPRTKSQQWVSYWSYSLSYCWTEGGSFLSLFTGTHSAVLSVLAFLY